MPNSELTLKVKITDMPEMKEFIAITAIDICHTRYELKKRTQGLKLAYDYLADMDSSSPLAGHFDNVPPELIKKIKSYL